MMEAALTVFRQFLHVCVAMEGRTLEALFGRPVPAIDGWFRLASILRGGLWQRAWHGTNIEALIVQHTLAIL